MNKLKLAGALAAALLAGAHAQAAQPLRVCAADNDLPYTHSSGKGFEDQLAGLLAESLGTTVERVGFSDPRYMVRDGIDKGTCDVMLGVDTGDPRLQTTGAYYRSSYVFITREKDALDVRDWSSPALKTANIGVIPATPAETMLKQIGRHSDSFRYLMSLGGNKSMRNRFVRYDVEKLVKDVASGEIDVAVAWAPAVARYVKASQVPLKTVPVPDARRSDGEPVVFSYDTSIGVKKGNTELLSRIETALQAQRTRFEQVLAQEGITTLTPQASRLAASHATPGVPQQ